MRGFDDTGSWGQSWAWGVPLIVATVVVRVLGLVVIRAAFARAFARHMPGRVAHMMRFSLRMGAAALLATVLHIIQAAVWAGAYVLLGALQALNGLILFGLTAAFLYGMVQHGWPGRSP